MLDERDFFAAAALAGTMAASDSVGANDTAALCYDYADAMMKARRSPDTGKVIELDPNLADLDPLDARPFGIPWGGRI